MFWRRGWSRFCLTYRSTSFLYGKAGFHMMWLRYCYHKNINKFLETTKLTSKTNQHIERRRKNRIKKSNASFQIIVPATLVTLVIQGNKIMVCEKSSIFLPYMWRLPQCWSWSASLFPLMQISGFLTSRLISFCLFCHSAAQKILYISFMSHIMRKKSYIQGFPPC